ncbi:hypothetical protein [Paracoccus beibuensis]|uniref:hypothetical protein n=1 Tax=Paracoccus beibuensis TaxID=547602 RepID=UPI002240220F|nr:hypothetical protein [Paracoccus beibuensis]
MFVVLYLVAVGAATVLVAALGISEGLSVWTILMHLAILLVVAQVMVVLYVAFQAGRFRRDGKRRGAGQGKQDGADKKGSRWDKVAADTRH